MTGVKLLFLLCIAINASLFATPATSAPSPDSTIPTSYRFGIVPQQSASKLVKLWTPLLQHLSTTTGLEFHFATARDIPSFEQALAEKEYDIAYMNPYHYTVFHSVSGYVALANDIKPLYGIIVTSQYSEINQLSELNQTALAFPAPAAFAATIVPRRTLESMDIKVTPFFVNSHESVYLNVISEFFKAGGGIVRSYEQLSALQRAQLRILWKSPPFNSHPIAALDSVPEAHRQAIISALTSMHTTNEGKTLLHQLNFEQLKAAHDSDWDNVRALDIKTITDFR